MAKCRVTATGDECLGDCNYLCMRVEEDLAKRTSPETYKAWQKAHDNFIPFCGRSGDRVIKKTNAGTRSIM